MYQCSLWWFLCTLFTSYFQFKRDFFTTSATSALRNNLLLFHMAVCLLKLLSVKQKNVTQSHYRPRQALGVPGVWGSQISRQQAHKGGKGVSPMHWPPLSPRKYSWYSVLLEAELAPGPLCGRKDCVNEKFRRHHRESNPRTSGFVVQFLNQLRYRVPPHS